MYFGNRNWEPYLQDAVTTMRDNGVRRAAVFATSAWGGYSSCGQYTEDIARARAAVGDGAPELVKLRQFFDHPLFVELFAEAITAARGTLPDGLRDDARLVFTAHSIPVAADERCGPNLYSRQVGYASRLVAATAGVTDYDQVWQSRSGPPQVPWLAPDIADHLGTLAERGTRAVIICPIGFLSDHIEVVWDLDTELAAQAAEAGIAVARAATPTPTRGSPPWCSTCSTNCAPVPSLPECWVRTRCRATGSVSTGHRAHRTAVGCDPGASRRSG